MSNTVYTFEAKQVANGWVLTINPGCSATFGEAAYVFAALPELCDFLKVQITVDTKKAI